MTPGEPQEEGASAGKRIMVVPGAAVRGYVRPAVDRARAGGAVVVLAGAPGEPGCPSDLPSYGRELARQLVRQPVDLLIGLSVGAQVAAVAAAAAPVRHLVVVSPTVDPACRSAPRLLGRWLAGGRKESPRILPEQLPDWWRAGGRRLAQVVRSALSVDLERILPKVEARLSVVHAEHDVITSHEWAARLATDHGGRLFVVPGATHSWPYADPPGFAELVERLWS
jgi:pimeloyl-ACP methyl ester carboxylesterase